MPEISVALQRRITETRIKVQSTSDSIKSFQPSPSIVEDDPIEVVYNIRTNIFRTLYRSNLFSQELRYAPLIEMQASVPPLLIDGRMQVRMRESAFLIGTVVQSNLCGGSFSLPRSFLVNSSLTLLLHQVIDIPRWKMKVSFLWRRSDGKFTKVRERVVRLPFWVWRERNLRRKFTELWIENV